MAGAGFKTFAASSVLTSTDVNTYLMQQAVMVFASAAARTAAITAPSEGMVTYLSDSNILQVYTGASWLTISDDGGLPVANGGTGSTTAAGARQNLGTGLTKIIPTSVTYAGGTGTTTNGVAISAGCTSVTMNGVFTSEFDSYFVRYVINLNTTTDIYFRLSVNGTARTDNWTWGVAQVNNAGTPGAIGGATTTYGWLTQNNQSVREGELTLSWPAVASQRTYRAQSVDSSNEILSHGYSFVDVATDGIQIYPATGLLYGRITVFGINK